MGVLFGRPMQSRSLTLDDLGVPTRSATGTRGAPATADRALRFSAVWAALRLRSDLISTMPVHVYRKTATGQTPAPSTRLFSRPSDGMLWHEWVYASQMDLDRYGNAFGQIVAREAGYPVQIELWPASEVTVLFTGRLIRGYRYGGKEFAPSEVWHERQYTVAGYPVGLSPLAYAAWAIGGGLAAQEFALDFYANGTHPTGTLRHTMEANLDPAVLRTAKARFKEATASRDLFATGKEWEFTPASVDANSAQFLEEQRATAVDVARYIGVPANAIDAAVSGQAITYANVAQRQLDLLTNFIAPATTRRELKLTADALPAPRFLKFNTDAILRLDPAARVDLTAKQIDARVRTPDEVRALENLPPLTPEQVDQFALLFPKESTIIGGVAP